MSRLIHPPLRQCNVSCKRLMLPCTWRWRWSVIRLILGASSDSTTLFSTQCIVQLSSTYHIHIPFPVFLGVAEWPRVEGSILYFADLMVMPPVEIDVNSVFQARAWDSKGCIYSIWYLVYELSRPESGFRVCTPRLCSILRVELRNLVWWRTRV